MSEAHLEPIKSKPRMNTNMTGTNKPTIECWGLTLFLKRYFLGISPSFLYKMITLTPFEGSSSVNINRHPINLSLRFYSIENHVSITMRFLPNQSKPIPSSPFNSVGICLLCWCMNVNDVFVCLSLDLF